MQIKKLFKQSTNKSEAQQLLPSKMGKLIVFMDITVNSIWVNPNGRNSFSSEELLRSVTFVLKFDLVLNQCENVHFVVQFVVH